MRLFISEEYIYPSDIFVVRYFKDEMLGKTGY